MKIKTKIADYSIIAVGALLYAVAVNVFTAPNNIAPGGLTGVATMLNFLFGLPIGTMIFIMNIPLFIWGAVVNGKRFLAKTIIASFLLSVFIDTTVLFIPQYKGDQMLASVFGGLTSGVGLALIFYRGGTTGGTDIIARNIHKKLPFVSMGNIILAADAVVIAAAGFVFGSLESSLYAVISIFVSTKIIDTIVYGVAGDNGKLLFVITSQPHEIANTLMEKIDRGITLLDAHGGYKYDEKKVIMCAVRPQQVHKASMIVRNLDKDAFIVVTTASAIKGNGFKTIE